MIRGARQVGKTWLVRELAGTDFKHLIEINFDETPEKERLFEGRTVTECLRLLEVDQGQTIIPDKTLIFLDEIQAAPRVFAKLRYFHENHPELHVVSAGSLLDFSLAEHQFSTPVGRIEYLFMGPMTFREFLAADQNEPLADFLHQLKPGEEIPEPIHTKLLDLLKIYYIVGGMPAVVNAYISSHNFEDVLREQQGIIQTFTDDFAKYQKQVKIPLLRKVFSRIPHLVGKKMKYAHIDREQKAGDLAKCVELLEMARIVYRISHSACNGIPLGAEAKPKDFKPLFMDTGLLSKAMGLKLTDFYNQQTPELINSGPVAEQFVGQHLLYSLPGYEAPELYYWNREKKSSSAEVDYVISEDGKIVPIEVKSGKSGTLRSLNLFMVEKSSSLAVRFDSNPLSEMNVDVNIPNIGQGNYTLVSLPIYLAEETRRLLKASQTGFDH